MRRGECADSSHKFARVIALCDAVGIHTRPARVRGEGDRAVWIVPLMSWYVLPEEGAGTLFVPKDGEDPTLQMWSDKYFVTWSALPPGVTPARYFLDMNGPYLARAWDAPVISFSHFLPRQDLIFATPEERKSMGPPRRMSIRSSISVGWQGVPVSMRRSERSARRSTCTVISIATATDRSTACDTFRGASATPVTGSPGRRRSRWTAPC